jgi:hypothetical protein
MDMFDDVTHADGIKGIVRIMLRLQVSQVGGQTLPPRALDGRRVDIDTLDRPTHRLHPG